MSKPIIEVSGLSKQYRIGHKESYKTLRETVMNVVSSSARLFKKNGTSENDTIWALKDVSFNVDEGEVLGIIGRNGAGKSTLLKILGRITEPTEGEIRIRGKIGSLLEVGTGFHPELTGRENVYLNGAILGMTNADIKRKFDEIVAFAEIEQFLDTPVKRYSSGMYVRLAFAVAAHLEPEILIVDEVLAVGDVQFQERCLGKLEEISAKEGRTVLFVSHNMSAIKSLCSKAILLEKGMHKYFGNAVEVVNNYLKTSQEARTGDLRCRTRTEIHDQVLITDVFVYNLSKHIDSEAETLDDLRITVWYEVFAPIHHIAFEWFIRDIYGTKIAFSSSAPMNRYIFRPVPGRHKMVCTIPKIPLSTGKYTLDVGITVPNIECIDGVERAGTIIITASDPYKTGVQYQYERAPVFIHAEWSGDGMESTRSS